MSYEKTLSFEDALEKAVENTIDIHIASQDEQIALAQKYEAKSVFYPNLYVSFGSGYIYDYGNKYDSTYIKNMYYTDSTRWHNSGNLGFEYNIFKGGVDYYNYKIADLGYKIQTTQSKYITKEVELKIVDIYSAILNSYHSRILYNELSIQKIM